MHIFIWATETAHRPDLSSALKINISVWDQFHNSFKHWFRITMDFNFSG